MHTRYRGFRFGGRDESVQPVLDPEKLGLSRGSISFSFLVTPCHGENCSDEYFLKRRAEKIRYNEDGTRLT